jgi:hypothetical protein
MSRELHPRAVSASAPSSSPTLSTSSAQREPANGAIETRNGRRLSAAALRRPESNEDARSFVLEPDASRAKYRHHFEEISDDSRRELNISGIDSAEHQVKQDPSGKLSSMFPCASR